MPFHRVRISDTRPDRSPKFQPILPKNFGKFTRTELRKLAQILADLKREDFYLTVGAEPVIMRWFAVTVIFCCYKNLENGKIYFTF